MYFKIKVSRGGVHVEMEMFDELVADTKFIEHLSILLKKHIDHVHIKCLRDAILNVRSCLVPHLPITVYLSCTKK